MPRRMSVRRSFRRGRGPRRKLVWARIVASGAAPFGAAPALEEPARLDGLLNFEQSLGASTVGVTVRRTRGYFVCYDTDQDPAAIEQVRFTAYVGDNNDIDDPANNNDNSFDSLSENRDFYLFEPFVLPPPADVNAGRGLSDTQGRLIDNRSSRKIEELNQTIVYDISGFSPNSAAAGTFGFTFDLSMLLALP